MDFPEAKAKAAGLLGSRLICVPVNVCGVEGVSRHKGRLWVKIRGNWGRLNSNLRLLALLDPCWFYTRDIYTACMDGQDDDVLSSKSWSDDEIPLIGVGTRFCRLAVLFIPGQSGEADARTENPDQCQQFAVHTACLDPVNLTP